MGDPNVLALDTASPTPSVTWWIGERAVDVALPDERRSTERVLGQISEAGREIGSQLVRLSRIAVCAGPGSFTGLRVGLATAWGIGRALNVPVEAVSTLEALAESAREWGAERIAALLDAGRGDVVVGYFDLSGPRAVSLSEPLRLTRAAAAEAIPGWTAVALPAELVPGGQPPSVLLSRAVARMVATRPRDQDPLRAIYGRPSAAEEKRGAS
jgi:tRNA threonylcarbamoyladenosine biosynthesis protein TsaB